MAKRLLRRIALLAALAGGCATDVTGSEAHRLVASGAWLLDVRTRAEFAERHPPEALNIPVEELKQRMGELGRAREIVVYCHTGVRAGAATILLRKAGLKVHNVGSLYRWVSSSDEPTASPF